MADEAQKTKTKESRWQDSRRRKPRSSSPCGSFNNRGSASGKRGRARSSIPKKMKNVIAAFTVPREEWRRAAQCAPGKRPTGRTLEALQDLFDAAYRQLGYVAGLKVRHPLAQDSFPQSIAARRLLPDPSSSTAQLPLPAGFGQSSWRQRAGLKRFASTPGQLPLHAFPGAIRFGRSHPTNSSPTGTFSSRLSGGSRPILRGPEKNPCQGKMTLASAGFDSVPVATWGPVKASTQV